MATDETLFTAKHEYISRSTDTIPNQAYLGTLENAFRIDRSVIGSDRVGEDVTVGLGEMTLNNKEGDYDNFVVDRSAVGGDIEIRHGDRFGPMNDWHIIMVGNITGSSVNRDQISFSVRDRGFELDTPASPNIYAGTGAKEGGDDLKGKRKPRYYGWNENVTPPLVIASAISFQLNDGPIAGVSAVYVRGVSLSPWGNFLTVEEMNAANINAGFFATCVQEGWMRVAVANDEELGDITCDFAGDSAVPQNITLEPNSWQQLQTTLTQNAGVAPDGTSTASKLTETVANNFHELQQSFTKDPSQISYQFAGKFKSSDRNLEIGIWDGVSAGVAFKVNLLTGDTLVVATAFGSGYTVLGSSVTEIDNGYWLVTLTVLSNAVTTVDPYIGLLNGSTSSYTGNGTSYMLFTDISFAALQFAETASSIVRGLLLTATNLEPHDIDHLTFDNVEATQPAPIGFGVAFGSDETVRSACSRIMASVGGWLGPRRSGVFEVHLFTEPSGTPSGEYDKTTVQDVTTQPLPGTLITPPYLVRVGWGRNQTPGQTNLAGSVSEERRSYLAEEFRFVTAENLDNQIDFPPGFELVEDDTFFRDEEDAQAEADRKLVLFGQLRWLYVFRLCQPLFIHEIGQVVLLTFPDRFDLEDGKLLRIVRLSEDDTAGVEVTAFG